MAVRRALLSDIPQIVDLVERLVVATSMPQAMDRDWTAATLAGLISSPGGAVWISAQGFLAASVTRTVISPDLIAQEHGWYSEDRQGLRLLRAYEAWAVVMGARCIQVSTGFGGPDLARLGYRATELAWVK